MGTAPSFRRRPFGVCNTARLTGRILFVKATQELQSLGQHAPGSSLICFSQLKGLVSSARGSGHQWEVCLVSISCSKVGCACAASWARWDREKANLRYCGRRRSSHAFPQAPVVCKGILMAKGQLELQANPPAYVMVSQSRSVSRRSLRLGDGTLETSLCAAALVSSGQSACRYSERERRRLVLTSNWACGAGFRHLNVDKSPVGLCVL